MEKSQDTADSLPSPVISYGSNIRPIPSNTEKERLLSSTFSQSEIFSQIDFALPLVSFQPQGLHFKRNRTPSLAVSEDKKKENLPKAKVLETVDIQAILRKLPFGNLSVASITNNLDVTEIKTLLRAKGEAIPSKATKSLISQAVLNLLEKGAFKSETASLDFVATRSSSIPRENPSVQKQDVNVNVSTSFANVFDDPRLWTPLTKDDLCLLNGNKNSSARDSDDCKFLVATNPNLWKICDDDDASILEYNNPQYVIKELLQKIAGSPLINLASTELLLKTRDNTRCPTLCRETCRGEGMSKSSNKDEDKNDLSNAGMGHMIDAVRDHLLPGWERILNRQARERCAATEASDRANQCPSNYSIDAFVDTSKLTIDASSQTDGDAVVSHGTTSIRSNKIADMDKVLSLYPAVKFVVFKKQKLGLVLTARSSSSHKVQTVVSIRSKVATDIDPIASQVLEVGDELICINGISPVHEFSYAEQLCMIKTLQRPLLLGFSKQPSYL